jgi:hypothetical protein
MTTTREVEAALNQAAGEDQRILFFVALLRKEAGLGLDDIVVVGGSAIELYTEGSYVSGDIDICAPREPLATALAAWGFKRPGREWARLDWRVVLDIVGRFPSGSMRHTRVLDTPYGSVRVGAVEDLIVRRLALVKFWNEPQEYQNARLLIALPGLDWEYLSETADREGVAEVLTELRREFGSERKKSRRRRKT